MTTKVITALDGGPARSPAAVLLARRGAVYLRGVTSASVAASPQLLAGVTMLETDLLDRGFLVSAELRAALCAMTPEALAAAGTAVLADIDAALGADRDHTPLFRGFPTSVPVNTAAHYVDRVLALLFQTPKQPCVLCGTTGTVQAVSPCAHLVCASCFDGAHFSACPLCERRIDPGDPYLRPARQRPAASSSRALPDRLRILAFGGDFTDRRADAARELGVLLSRTAALSPQDTDDLTVLLDEVGDRTALSWLPETIPGRETKARVLTWLLRDQEAFDITLPATTARISTATDVLRLLAVRGGGDAGLIDVPRLTAVPRPLRRALLGALDTLDPHHVAEDMRRYTGVWIAVGEVLHPFEYAQRFPRAAFAFAALRRSRLREDALSSGLTTMAGQIPGATAGDNGVQLPVWAAQVEAALADRDVAAAVELLATRPGELLRRLDHLLRIADADAARVVLDALHTALPRVSPAVILSALGSLRTRTAPHDARVFFPKGTAAKAYLATDERPALAADVVDRAVQILTDEILRRASELPDADIAVVDAELHGLLAPFAERTASRALVTLQRGSELAIAPGRTLRVFLHWMESATSGTTDLDLAIAFFDSDWEHVGTCDYTNLRYRSTAAVHSGDRQNAPAPQGATESADLDLDLLAAAGVRYALVNVFSYAGAPFAELSEAFAGVMVRDEPGAHGPVFDPRQVEQRFDLTAPAKSSVAMVVDVQSRTMRWFDVVQGVRGTHHAVHRHVHGLATLGKHLTAHFASGMRIGLGELATWHAAARARTVVVRHADGSASTYRRHPDEELGQFAARIGTPAADAENADPSQATLAFLVHGDLPLRAGSQAYALHPAALNAADVRLLAAPDLVSTLAPE